MTSSLVKLSIIYFTVQLLLGCTQKQFGSEPEDNNAQVIEYSKKKEKQQTAFAEALLNSQKWGVFLAARKNQSLMSNLENELENFSVQLNNQVVQQRRIDFFSPARPTNDIEPNYLTRLYKQAQSLHNSELISSKKALEDLTPLSQQTLDFNNNLNLFIESWSERCQRGLSFDPETQVNEAEQMSPLPALCSERYGEMLAIEELRGRRRFANSEWAHVNEPTFSSKTSPSYKQFEQKRYDLTTLQSSYTQQCQSFLTSLKEIINNNVTPSELNDFELSFKNIFSLADENLNSYNEKYNLLLSNNPHSTNEKIYHDVMNEPEYTQINTLFENFIAQINSLLKVAIWKLVDQNKSLIDQAKSLRSAFQNQRKIDIVYADHLKNTLLDGLRSATYQDELLQQTYHVTNLWNEVNEPQFKNAKNLLIELDHIIWNHASELIVNIWATSDQSCPFRNWQQELATEKIAQASSENDGLKRILDYLSEKAALLQSTLGLSTEDCNAG